jgi:hypothetical protein
VVGLSNLYLHADTQELEELSYLLVVDSDILEYDGRTTCNKYG